MNLKRTKECKYLRDVLRSTSNELHEDPFNKTKRENSVKGRTLYKKKLVKRLENFTEIF